MVEHPELAEPVDEILGADETMGAYPWAEGCREECQRRRIRSRSLTEWPGVIDPAGIDVFEIHRSERADALARALSEILVDRLPDPFQQEVVAVHTRGMERWLSQRLSERLGATASGADGVCANISFPFPGRLARDAVAAASDIDSERDPWLPERMVWPLIHLLDLHWNDEWLSYVASYVTGFRASGSEPLGGRRFAAARKIARLFDRYALLRPDMVRAWARGEDRDDDWNPLDSEFRWQAELWRRVRAEIGEPSPAERVETACVRLRDEPELVDLPPRISLFCLTRLPAGEMQVLKSLAATRDVHLFALHPSPTLWRRVAETGPSITARAEDTTATLPRNPLLRSWGKDARELQLILGAESDAIDKHHPCEFGADSLLERIQADIRADREASGAPGGDGPDDRALLEPGDDSIQIHACHGRARQVEIMREAILHALDDDPSIEPRDVIVMCPDIEAFAPLIQATFGSVEPLPAEALAGLDLPVAPRLRVRLADRALRQTNPVLGVIARLIEMVPGRLTASQVLDLADAEPVRRRFGFDDDDLTQLEAWASTSGVHWGLDAEHRKTFQLEAVSQGTWRAGLDRILVGAAMSEDGQRLFGDILPLDDVPSGAIALAGRFAEFVDRLRLAVDHLRDPKPIAAWVSAIAEIADGLTATTSWESWHRAELQRVLDGLADEATVAGRARPAEVRLEEIQILLAERLQGHPTWMNFRTGHLTICTLMPMRSVPHRVVCLLGLDDGAFPRHAAADGDDLTLDEPRVGERDARLEDRQLLLDAVLSATDRIIVTYTGNDERTNQSRPPAVPIAELLDIINQTARGESGPATDRVLTRHPLQPFDPRNFAAGELRHKKPWGYSEVDLDGARASAGDRIARSPFLSTRLSEATESVIELDDLVRFVQHPARAFLNQRLNVSLFRTSEQLDDGLPIELDGLQEWHIGQRMLEARLDGLTLDNARRAEIARGDLPPGELARPTLNRIADTVEQIAQEVLRMPASTADPTSLDIRVSMGADRILSGTLAGIRGAVLRRATYSRVGASHRLTSWVRFLAMSAAYPERPLEAFVIGRAPRGPKIQVARLDPLGDDENSRRRQAVDALAILVDLYDRGMREPLPLACRSSAAFADATFAYRDAEKSARAAWETGFRFDGEDRDEHHRLVWDGVRSFDDLIAEAPRPDEGWGSHPSRFGSYALRLWSDLLAHERIENR